MILFLRFSADCNGENELHENYRSANLRLEKICQQYLRFTHLNSKKISYDIQHMRSKACPTSTCLSICIIHLHTITSHWNRLGVFKIHHKEFSISFKCYSFKYVCSNLPTIVGLRIINVDVCRVYSLRRFVSTSSTQIVPKVSIR